MLLPRKLVALLSVALFGCSTSSSDGGTTPPPTSGPVDAGAQGDDDADVPVPDAGFFPDASAPIFLEAEPQRAGDPAAGLDVLLNRGYVGCGVPLRAYNTVFGNTPEWAKVPGRNTLNANLPYNQTAFETATGVDVVMANCLACHATRFRGEIVIGLGDSNADYTNDPSGAAQLAGFLLNDPAERAEWQKWLDRLIAVGPYIQASTIGANPQTTSASSSSRTETRQLSPGPIPPFSTRRRRMSCRSTCRRGGA